MGVIEHGGDIWGNFREAVNIKEPGPFLDWNIGGKKVSQDDQM